ncbi:MAG: nitroreductase family protein [Candidatus Omnitrophica bacterium]|nr:nitroreductase family protein [Candidatus Omnitrophota bacterium]
MNKEKIGMDLIKNRRSVRSFKEKSLSLKTVEKILEAGRWAPSGLNNQPWRFMVLEKSDKDRLVPYTHYGHVVKAADKVVLVFLDKKKSYHREKDLMALGACIQNMLLAASAVKLGACWLGEILNQKKAIQKALNCAHTLELWGCIALGVPAKRPGGGRRFPLKKLIVKI